MDDHTDYTPHDCPQCGHPAYIGFATNPVCSNRDCQWFDTDTWVGHVMSLPDAGDPLDEIEDADTEPKGVGMFGWGRGLLPLDSGD